MVGQARWAEIRRLHEEEGQSIIGDCEVYGAGPQDSAALPEHACLAAVSAACQGR